VFSGLLAIRAGPGGAVRALEPHPEIHHDLCETVRRWRAAPGLADIEVCAAAAAATDGRAELVEPEAFGANRGRATLFPPVGEERRRSWSVTTVTLDGFLHDWAGVGVLKVDVEGAEPAVLDGARHLLAGGRIRDIVLEDHAPQPSVLADRLRAVGYRVWAIASTFWGPHLADPARLRPSPYLAPSLLATLEPDRAVARLAAAGWRCLRS
jgi:FkbM family methyltransferase